jgi:hypothetical protein
MDDFRRVRLSEGYSDVTFVCQGAEVAALAGKRREIFMAAILAFHAGKTIGQFQDCFRVMATIALWAAFLTFSG